jgi:hypothetical protein
MKADLNPHDAVIARSDRTWSLTGLMRAERRLCSAKGVWPGVQSVHRLFVIER